MQADRLNIEEHYHRCQNCNYFNDYNERSGRGWCKAFDNVVRQQHQATSDCYNNGAIFQDPQDPEWELNQPHTKYQIGDRVKLIDNKRPHTMWRIYTIVNKRYNYRMCRSLEAYLNETEWYFQIVGRRANSQPFEVKENDICLEHESHLICTEDIF